MARISIFCICLCWSVSAFSADVFYGFSKPLPKSCEEHLWGHDCPEDAKQANDKVQPQNIAQVKLSKHEPKTAEEYQKQIMWKYMPEQYKLNEEEKIMLGALQPETATAPLPILKFILRPKNESPEQTKKDYLAYMSWYQRQGKILENTASKMTQYISGGNSQAQMQELIQDKPVEKLVKTAEISMMEKANVSAIKDQDLMFLYFFNSHCPYCEKMSAVLKSYLSTHPLVSMVGYGRNEPLEASQKYFRKLGFNQLVTSAPEGIFDRYNIDRNAFPRLLILNRVTGDYYQIKGYNPESEIYKGIKWLSVQVRKS